LLESGSSLLEREKFKQGSNLKNMLKLFGIGFGGSGLGADQKPEREWRKSPATFTDWFKIDRFFNSGQRRVLISSFFPGDEVAKKIFCVAKLLRFAENQLDAVNDRREHASSSLRHKQY
jgi:hypothetical protein